jgi:hypothetical protein
MTDSSSPAGQGLPAERSPVTTLRHLAKVVHPSPRVLRQAMGEVDGFNAKFAVLITRLVGTMWCAYLFCLIALMSLPAILIEAGVLKNADVPKVLTKPGLILIVAWIAQTFIQLVLLSVIMVGQNVQSLAADARAANTFKDAETILDRLDLHTQGGLKDILDKLDELGSTIAGTKASSAGESGRSGT